MIIALVCIPAARNINGKDLVLERNELIDKVTVGLSYLPLERKAKYTVHNHGLVLQMLAEFLVDRVVLILKKCMWMMGYPIEFTQYLICLIFTLQLLKSNNFNWVIHHCQMSCCNQSISPVVTWSHQNCHTLVLSSQISLVSLLLEYAVGNLSTGHSSKLHKGLRRKGVSFHQSFIKKTVHLSSAIGDCLHFKQSSRCLRLFIIKQPQPFYHMPAKRVTQNQPNDCLCINQIKMDDVPSAEADGCGARIALLWATNKPLLIGILALLTLVVFGVIFLIVWFVILKKGSSTDDQQAAAHTAHMIANQAHLTLRGLTTAIE